MYVLRAAMYEVHDSCDRVHRAEQLGVLPAVEEPALVFSMVAALLRSPGSVPDDAFSLSFHVGKKRSGSLAKSRAIGRITHSGIEVSTVDLFNAVQRAGGAAAVRLLERSCLCRSLAHALSAIQVL